MNDVTRVREPYSDPERQAEAAMMGIFVFIGTEIMLFGGLFLTIAWLRLGHTSDVIAASKEMHWLLAGFNTAVLLTSSAAVALAVEKAKEGAGRAVSYCLAVALFLGLGFMLLKGVEYVWEYREGMLPLKGSGYALQGPIHRLFMDLYLISTVLHAIHLAVGILLLSALLISIRRRRISLPDRAIFVMAVGIYWHFVDVVWIFLYPFLYLAR